MHAILLILFIVVGVLTTMAQQPQSWLMSFGQIQYKQSRIGVHYDVQFRDFKLIGDHNQTLLRAGLFYRFKPYFQSSVGYAFVYSEAEGSPNNPFNENRIFQEGLFTHKALGAARIRHRLRLEERFIEKRAFRGRFRYYLLADIPLTEGGLTQKGGFYGALYNELFLNIEGKEDLDAFDRNRAYGALGYRVSNNTGVQVGYMRQNIGKANGTNHLMLSLHQQLHWK